MIKIQHQILKIKILLLILIIIIKLIIVYRFSMIKLIHKGYRLNKMIKLKILEKKIEL